MSGQKIDYASEVDQITVSDPMAEELAAMRKQLENIRCISHTIDKNAE